jgi:hypothetical protein
MHASGSKPPGKAAFSIEPVFDEGNGIEVLDSLPLGSVMYETTESVLPACYCPLEEWRGHYLYWCDPLIHARNEIGDCYAMVADAILTLDQPYPGDEYFSTDSLRPEIRFNVTYQEDLHEYWIQDRLVDVQVSVSRTLLERPKFDISKWYATRRMRALNLAMDSKPADHCYAMGHTVNLVAAKLLTDGIFSSYPCTNPELDPRDRFVIYPLKPGRDEYTISDADLESFVRVPKSLLEEPTFDLVGWYRQQLVLQKAI